MCVVARENAPSAVGREDTTLNVGNDIVGETPLSLGLGSYNVSSVEREGSSERSLKNEDGFSPGLLIEK